MPTKNKEAKLSDPTRPCLIPGGGLRNRPLNATPKRLNDLLIWMVLPLSGCGLIANSKGNIHASLLCCKHFNSILVCRPREIEAIEESDTCRANTAVDRR